MWSSTLRKSSKDAALLAEPARPGNKPRTIEDFRRVRASRRVIGFAGGSSAFQRSCERRERRIQTDRCKRCDAWKRSVSGWMALHWQLKWLLHACVRCTSANCCRLLEERFRILTGGNRSALPRHQTMRALIDWSHDLLSPQEQTLFRRLSVFNDGWSLEAASAVCADETLESWNVLDAPRRARRKIAGGRGSGSFIPRYRFLESTRHYAVEKLIGRGGARSIARRAHAVFHAVRATAGAAMELRRRRAIGRKR